jgi:hypothetical protein
MEHRPTFSNAVSSSGLQPGVLENILGGKQKHLTGYVKLKKNIFPDEKTPWPEFTSELYRPSDRRLLAKLVPTFADRGCHVVSVTDP